MKQDFSGEALEAVLVAAQRPTSNEDSRTDRSSSLGGLRRRFVTSPWCKSRVGTLAAALGVLGIIARGVTAQAPADLTDVLARVGDRVRQFYGRAQSIVCFERVTVQPLRRDMMPEGFSRVLDFELRIDWDASAGGDQPPEARIMRELRKVNGRTPRPKDLDACLDPKSGALEPLAMLLPHHREEYTFAWTGFGRVKNKRAMMLDYKSRVAGPIEGKWKGDCVSIDAPGRTKPESIELLTIFRNAQSYRISQTFSEYKRFMTAGRIVK